MMATLFNAALGIPSSPCFSFSKQTTLSPLRCLRNNQDVNGFHELRLEINGDKNVEKSKSITGDDRNAKQDIWGMFKEAQQNILYLNKQRLKAIDELNKIKREKQALLSLVEKLEAEKMAGAGRDNQSIFSDLLLRIDSMVLNNVISPGEASELRRLVISHKVGVYDVFNVTANKGDSELLGELRQFSYGRKKSGFHIVHICTEMAPLVPNRSIASYVTGISCALQRKGHLVEVIMPKYASLNLDEVQGLRKLTIEAYSYFNGQLHENRIWTGVVHGIGVTLIEPLHYSSFFNRDMINGYPDDFERFSYFSRASLDYIVKCGKQPDVLHLHNWETAIVGPLFWDIFANQGLENTRILLTCHGFNSQCTEQPDKLALCGLDPERLNLPDRLQDNINMERVNILKGGVVYSNKVLIMSSVHPKHTMVHNLSHGLEPTLNIHWDKLAITPYGFDKSTWNPSSDSFLPENFNAENMNGKVVCKLTLQQRLGLSERASNILVACIFPKGAELDVQKVKGIILHARQQNIQFIFMGTNERSVMNQTLEGLKQEIKDKNMRIVVKYDEALLHLVFAGSDIILCQSFLDPTDEIPLKALRYGAAPITHLCEATTNRNFMNHDQEATKYSQLINSSFGNMSLSFAVDEIRNNPSKWRQRMMEAMTQDFSWDGECYDAHVEAYSAIKNL
ncbi:probable starch synthase 4, chloroplastic/amyloplastic isoform X1 [Arachis ipaensis]|uniref:probable starch synthase 4, chloroplastic/amyloplastic isoform X1 n=1 Tax=Arachis ipaensis TaxID=130454 RepID=UPI000A2B009F|nr:probable starch synthase 4, chloroplastic/amyloplastic isoform X1 [Arachis ipaensis]